MKKINYYLIIFFILFFTNSYANNIVFVDMDYLIKNSSIGKKIINQLEKEDKKNINILKQREEPSTIALPLFNTITLDIVIASNYNLKERGE